MKKFVGTFLRAGLIQNHNRFTFLQIKGIRKANFTTIKGDSQGNQVPEEVKKMMQSKKTKRKPQELAILKDISQVKSMDELPEIFQKMVFMSKQHRQIALHYLLSGIYQQNIPIEAITYKALQMALNEYPHLKMETQIFQTNILIKKMNRIKEQMGNPEQNQSRIAENKEKLDNIFNQINNLYYKSFNTTLKLIQSEHITRSKATLYKHFAEYNFNYLFEPTISEKGSHLFQLNQSVLQKARDFLIESLNCHKQILLNEHKKLQSDENGKQKEDESERKEIRLNAIKQNIRKIVESIGECLYAYFKVINKEHRLVKDAEAHKKRKIQLLSLIDTYIPLYSIIPGIKQLSILYHKLYKIKIESKFTAVGEPKTQEEIKAKVKEALEEYNRLYKQCQDCLEESIKFDNFNSIKEISTTIISIKYMIGRTVKKDQNQIKNSLAIEAKNIIDKMNKQFKQPAQIYLMQIIKEMLNIKT